MRTVHLAGILIIAVHTLAQAGKPPILVSHNRTDGPFGGEYHVQDLQVFPDGRVLYVEEGTKELGQQPTQASYDAQMRPEEIQQLARLLDSPEVRSISRKIPSKTRPIDFFWQNSIEINHADGKQRIEIENFYPFLNFHRAAYSAALIELECTLQDIQAKAAKSQSPTDENGWCKKLAAR